MDAQGVLVIQQWHDNRRGTGFGFGFWSLFAGTRSLRYYMPTAIVFRKKQESASSRMNVCDEEAWENSI